MADPAGTPSAQTRRKTLDEIRREIDAEFAPPDLDAADGDAPPDLDAADGDASSEGAAPRDAPVEHYDAAAFEEAARLEALLIPHRNPRWRTYLKVALVVTFTLETFILGYLLGDRYGDERLRSLLATFTGEQRRSAAPVMAAAGPKGPETDAPSSAIPSEPLPRDAEEDVAPKAVGPSQTPVAEPQTADQAPASGSQPAPPMSQAPAPPLPPPSPVVPPPPAPAAQPPAPVAQPAAPAVQLPPRTASKPLAPLARATAPPVSAPSAPVAKAPPTLGPVLGASGDWVESQSQLRAALREWLVLSGRGGAADPEGADVILGADGYTAKTRVVVRLNGQAIVREQRWTRARTGWHLVDERQLHPPRP